MAEREGIEPTFDHNSQTTVLKTAAATRHASLSVIESGQISGWSCFVNVKGRGKSGWVVGVG